MVSRGSDETGLRRSIEHFVAPAARKLGWRTEFGWERYLAWLAETPGIELAERRATPPFGHFSLIRFRKTGARDTAAPGHLPAHAANGNAAIRHTPQS